MPISIVERSRQWDEFAEPYARLANHCAPNMLDVLAALAKDRPVIELGGGAGRVCIPLAQRGLMVTAAEFSPEMIRHLRDAAARQAVELEILPCDFSNLPLNKRFGLAYCIDNGFFALCSEEEQLRCFGSVAGLLDEGGSFVVEASAPTPAHLEAGSRVVYAGPDRTMIERFASDGRTTISHITETIGDDAPDSGQAVRVWRLAHHYIPVTKFDEYAGLCMLALTARWSDWRKAPHDGNPWRHISVWRRESAGFR